MVTTDSRTTGDHRSVAVIVAHPDDEVLWCGGLMVMHPDWHWTVVTLCRGADADRAPRFERVMQRLGAKGVMAEMDDGPDQTPLDDGHVRSVVIETLPADRFDLVLTHGPLGEYTRHRRHEECCRAVVGLWGLDKLRTASMWLFAYEDNNRTILPRVRADADYRLALPQNVWQQKHDLVVKDYGFAADSWEARATPREEGFWCFDSARVATERINAHEVSS